jgi:hypothetical protein
MAALAPTPPKYAEWIDFFFARIERDTDDPWTLDWDFKASPSEIADLFEHTMQNCGRDLAAFSDKQLAAGLNGLLFGNYGSVPHILIGAGVSDAQKLDVLRSLKRLYSDCLAKRSPPVLGHINETQSNPLEFVTYMLWDVTPLDSMANRAGDRFDALLDVLSHALRLPNEACVESALHGLGHLRGQKAQAVIDRWLDGKPSVRPSLIAYARSARTGCIQ